MSILQVAGTSSGGSSYTDRIINTLIHSDTGHNLVVFITAGDCQLQVKSRIQRNVEQLNTLLRQRGCYPIMVTIELET